MTNEFLWEHRPQPSRGPKPLLTIEGIADAAIGIADAEGLGAVSMQRVAEALGFTKMSLYRYLPGKAELVALMVERGIGEPPDVDLGGSWQGGLRTWSGQLLAAYMRHPWALGATVGPRLIGPNELSWMECALSLLAGTSLTATERLDTVAVLAGHVRMIAEQASAAKTPETSLPALIAGRLQVHGARFPALTATMAAVMAEGTGGAAFDFGLDRILAGLQVLTEGRRAARGGRRERR
jgi:AcrR family transcriptional regulator